MLSIIIFIVIVALIYVGYHFYCNQYWKHRTIDNFPFIHKGRLFWYSRSVATTLFAFAKGSDGRWYVLANKRGEGAADFQGLWNAPCGYLNFNEDGEESAQRETFEETGIFIPRSEIKLWKAITDPSQNHQNVSFKYYTILEGICESYTFSMDNMEVKEVEEIAWVPVDIVDRFSWAFGHNENIKEIAAEILETNV